MKNFGFYLLALVFFFTRSLFAQPDMTPTCPMEGSFEENTGSSLVNCNNSTSNFHTQHTDDMVPEGISGKIKIKTNVIFVQDDGMPGGVKNFSVSNPDHMEFWDKVFTEINTRLENIEEATCECSTNPVHYPNVYYEYIPNYVEVKSHYYWDHLNDPDPLHDSDFINSCDKPYLNEIVDLAEQQPGYEEGINVVITIESTYYNEYIANNETIPIWDFGYIEDNYYAQHWYSCPPSTNLSFRSIWHAPDLYLLYYANQPHVYPWGNAWLEESYIPTVATNFIHEYGHSLALGQKTNSCPENYMRGAGWTGRRSFTGCQVRQSYMAFMNTNLRKYIVCEEALDYDLVVDTDETWRLNLRVYGDVVIKNGASLTISCEVHMSPNGKIVVERGGELIVDGGLITTDCSSRWKGIVVEGDVPGSQALSGKVILRNQAILEYATIAVSMYPTHIPWNSGGQEDYFGGIIQAETSTIRHCGRAVEFMKYGEGVIKDVSFFDNVTFEDLDRGVTIWSDDGIIFDNCTFNNIEKSGIYAYDSEVVVREDNTFTNIPIGVDLLSTYQRIVSSKIGQFGYTSNSFMTDKGIYSQSGSNIEPIKIQNNDFSGGSRGIKHNGNAFLDIDGNNFDDIRNAIEMYDGGVNYNMIKKNVFADSHIGSVAAKNNIGLQYLDNCFTGIDLFDIGVSGGAVFPYQGSSSVAAGNCFTKGGVPEIYNQAGLPLNYYVKTGTATSSCKYPTNSVSITILPNSFTDVGLPCTLMPIVDHGFCTINPSNTISQLKSQRTTVLQSLNGPLNTIQRKTMEGCLENLESLIGQKMLDPASTDPGSGKENAITFFTSTGTDFKDWTTAYGIMVQFGEYSRARTFINGLSTIGSEQSNFVFVQNINLDYLDNPASYVLSSTNESSLYSMGTTDGPLNGYARSLYEVLTGDRIDTDVPLTWRSDLQESNFGSNPLFKVFPNPIQSEILNISIEKMGNDVHCHLVIVDALGSEKKSLASLTNGDHIIDMESFPSGLYFLNVYDNFDLVLYQTKVVVIK